ncbi:MAG: ATP-binding protein [Gemmatimonadetes bacterium]|nr:ATP-binding protein [Gemmatimonadota bacterium]
MTSRSPTPSAEVSGVRRLGSLGPWVATAALALWTGGGGPAVLLVAAIGLMGGVLLGPRGRGRWSGIGTVMLLLGILVGFHAERQVHSVRSDWDGYWAKRVTEIGELLSGELDRRQLAGEAAADALIAATESASGVDASVVSEIRGRHGTSALGLYDRDGNLLVWDGTHRGKIPETVQRGERRQSYRDLPLFGYLYLTSTAPDGGVAVAAYLLRASLPEGLGADMGDLATRFYRETGERIRITEEDPGIAEAVWDLALDDDRLLSVVLERPDRDIRAATIRDRWAAAVALMLVVGWLLIAIGGAFRLTEAIAAAVALVAAAAWVPVDQLAVARHLFDPTLFTLPGPIPLALGTLSLVSMAGFALVAVLPRPAISLPPWGAGVLAGVGFPAILMWIQSGLGPGALSAGRLDWIAYELTGAALLSLLAGTAIAFTREGDGSRPAVLGAIAFALLLGVGSGAWVYFKAEGLELLSVAWVIPVGVAAYGVRAWDGWRRSLLGWTAAIVMGATATIPLTWGDAIEARLQEGTQRLQSLAAVEDVEMENRLLAFGRLADSLDLVGAEDVSILYDGWRLSGLSDLGQPVWLQMELRDGSPGEGLRVGVGGGEPEPYQDILAQGRVAGGIRLVQLNQDDARYILTTALSNDRMVVAVAPPFPESTGRSALGPLLRVATDGATDALAVLPLAGDEEALPGGASRMRTRRGWQAEIGLSFSNHTAYHAHYLVDLPGVPLSLARATLLMVLNLALFLAFWVGGRGLLGSPARAEMRISGLVISFRARVTLALFGFFALANALFGTVAYRTLAQASHRSAQVIAERVVEDAAGWYRALGGQMDRLASQVGAELLEYRDGELREGSVDELVELGMYEAWTPYEVHERLASREVVQEFTETSVGSWQYVTAYRRLADGDVLAAQVPLQAGTSALQTTDLIELLGFVILLGAALSLGLAMIAGRALTRPIHALQVASESVGSGDLGLRLPAHRTDEFGAVFRAFNRMVGRVRRARRQLVRTSRRTQLIMDEAAVGMVALDPGGRVTLVNPRAEELMGVEVFVGRQLPSDGEVGDALTSWLASYMHTAADEANSDFQVGDRRIRVRVRRLGSFGTRRGVVVALDDVTDELRAERVIAWGEMARQVAHEVKNPLTPIKLSIQHVRRAWDDRHPDFENILIKNADAMLIEIDRLAGIAQSFSRFGTPGGDQIVPLAAVSLREVVTELMALYGGSNAQVRFEQELEAALPPVVARPAELKEVLVNLLENARLAGQEGTRVIIKGRRSEDGQSVVLSVVDDGAGIPEDVLPRIFEPQFSTRSTGTGLGLAIVQRVVRAWGGSVAVKSELGVGTTVSVTLRVWPE